ncbi:MAG: lpxA [Chlamydiales bacterium]|jgi:UDP-N-acetylglucosamine acyltransferase|nr:lpxA [Chlamydiales bacterium]
MVKNNIHPAAIIEPGAEIGQNVTVEPLAVIKSGVTLQDNVVVKSHAYLDGNTTVGEGSVIWPGASIGTSGQDLKYRGEKASIVIGKNCQIREYTTINAPTQENSTVRIGDQCFIMAYCHIAHDCIIGNRVIMGNNATLSGHVTVEDYANIGGFTPVHQFVRIGKYSFVGGMSRVTHDVPPYMIGGGIPFKYGGLNLVGLKRNGFSLETRKKLSQGFRLLFRSRLRLEVALEKIEAEIEPIPEIQHLISFCRATKRGFIGSKTAFNASDEVDLLENFEEEAAIWLSR